MYIRDLAIGQVATAPSPATSGLTLVLNGGQGADMPTTLPLKVIAFPPGTVASKVNAEHLLVTNISTDTLTFVRAQGETSAQSIAVGWLIAAAIFSEDVNSINSVINGACMVAQRPSAPSLSTTSQYGLVDRFRVHATGSAVSAGTITQDAAAALGVTGYALKIAGATITGTGIVFVKHRIEARDALIYKNLLGSFACRVRHDVGSAKNFTITIRKPTTTPDDFTAVTDIQIGTAISVPDSADTRISLENVSMGDCSKGIEIEIKIECGAVTTKNFWLTEFQLNPGQGASHFIAWSYERAFAACQRYYVRLVEPKGVGTAGGSGASMTRWGFNWPVRLRATPVVAIGAIPIYEGGTTATISSIGTNYSNTVACDADVNLSTSISGPRSPVSYLTGGSAAVTADAEL